jgi:hypothetical protein
MVVILWARKYIASGSSFDRLHYKFKTMKRQVETLTYLSMLPHKTSLHGRHECETTEGIYFSGVRIRIKVFMEQSESNDASIS